MKRNVKKGSALITVLFFSLIFLAMSSVTVLAVINTLTGNSREELDQTLYYEAEAGIEKAMAKVNEPGNEYLDDSRYSIGGNPIPDIDFNMNKGTVKVKMKKTGDYDDVAMQYRNSYILVESTSKTRDGKFRTVTARLRKRASTMDIFRYSICGSNVEVMPGGSFDGATGSINATDDLVIDVGGGYTPGDEDNAAYTGPVFKDSNGVDTIPFTEKIELDVTGESPYTIKERLSSHPSVVKLTLKLPTLYHGFYGTAIRPAREDMTIYLVNTDELVIRGKGTEAISMSMIICSGDITLLGNGLSPSDKITLDLVRSTMLGKKIKIQNASLKISERPFNETNPFGYDKVTNVINNTTQEPMFEENIRALLDGTDVVGGLGLSHYAPNMSDGSEAGGSSLVIPVVPSDYN